MRSEAGGVITPTEAPAHHMTGQSKACAPTVAYPGKEHSMRTAQSSRTGNTACTAQRRGSTAFTAQHAAQHSMHSAHQVHHELGWHWRCVDQCEGQLGEGPCIHQLGAQHVSACQPHEWAGTEQGLT